VILNCHKIYGGNEAYFYKSCSRTPRSTSALTGSSSSRPEELQGSSISLSGNLHPQILLTIPLSLLIGGSELAASQVHCRSLGSRIPETRWPVNADFIFPCQDFSYRDFATRDIEHFDLPTPDTRCTETPMHTCELTFSTSRHFYQDFRIRGIANPDVDGLGTCLFSIPDMYATCPPLTPAVAHTTLPSGYRGSRFQLSVYLILKTPIFSNPDFPDLLTRVLYNGRF
jgi:hypothetical protein